MLDLVADEVHPDYLAKTLKSKLRFVMLLLASTFTISNYFLYDNPAAIEAYLTLKYSPEFYSSLYIAYALPILFLPLISLYLVTWIG